MKRYIAILFSIIAVAAHGQAIYRPSYTPLFTVASKPYAISQGAPVDGRSYKADSINFLWRPYNGTTEVLSYLPGSIPAYRTGQFPIEVNVGGTLNSNGTFTGGYIYEYWFRGGIADSNLVLKSYWPTNTSGFLQAVNNLSDVDDTTTAQTNLGLGTMAKKTATAGGDLTGLWPAITVADFNGEAPAYYLNYNNLTNKPTIPAQVNITGTPPITVGGTYPNVIIGASVAISPTLAQVVYAGNHTDSSMYSADSVSDLINASKTVYVGDSNTYSPLRLQDTIFGYGNSIMEGVAATDGLAFFFQYCQDVNALGLDSGVSGTFLTGFQSSILPTLPVWKPHHKIMLLYETNDYYDGITLAAYLSTYQAVIDSLQSPTYGKNYPDSGIILLFCSLSDTTEGGLTPYGMAPWATSLDSFAIARGIPHVDLWHYMYNNGNFALNYATSLLHPNQAGHNVITEAMLLALNNGSATVKRPFFSPHIKNGQQIVVDAPLVEVYGDQLRQYNNLPRPAYTDILTSSTDLEDIRPEVTGGIGTGDNSSILMSADNQNLGKEITAGVGAYTWTNQYGVPQTGGYGFQIYTAAADNGLTLFRTFNNGETYSGGGPIAIVAGNSNPGVEVFTDGGVSIGSTSSTGHFYISEVSQFGNEVLLQNLPAFTTSDKLLTWNPSQLTMDTVGYNNLPGPPIGDFAPSSGNTITLFTKAYNVITPTGTILALTVTLPATPATGDWVKVKFNNAVTTVTWAGGTVVAPTTVTQYQYFELHYNGTQWE